MNTIIPMTPWIPTSANQSLAEEIFIDCVVPSRDSKKFTYSTSHDFGKIIHELLITRSEKKFSSRFCKNIEEIGQIEGFKVRFSNKHYYSRDPLLNLQNSILAPSFLKSHQDVSTTLQTHINIFKNHPFIISKNDFFNFTLGEVGNTRAVLKAAEEIPIKKTIRIYFEGGNCFHISNQNNEPQWIIGEDLAIATHHCLYAEKWFDPLDESNPSLEHERTHYAQNKDPLHRSFMKGEIPQIIEEMAIPISQEIPIVEIENTLVEILATTRTSNKRDQIQQELHKLKDEPTEARKTASEYRAQLEFVKQEIFPNELETAQKNVHFIYQPGYHVDLFIAPWHKGFALLQDYSLSFRVLQTILTNAQQLNLSKLEIQEVRSFLQTTQKVAQELNPLMKKIKTQLKQAGLIPIPTPGVFFGSRRKIVEAALQIKKSNINFLNAITGFSPKNKHFYYITSGAQGRLGQILMDIFVSFLNRHADNTVVYFVGRKRKTLDNFREARRMLNDYFCGPHCLSFELETESYTTN